MHVEFLSDLWAMARATRPNLPYWGNCNMMEFTGLKDKNGKEIWEGDVVVKWWVSITGNTKVNEGQGVVKFNKGKFYYVSQGGTVLLDGHEYDISDKLEVIGNVYENPELRDKT